MGYYSEMAVKLARRSDPASSKVAAAKLVNSGALTGQCRIVYEALKLHPKSTAKELAVKTSLDYHMLCKRLPVLEKKGFAKVDYLRLCKYGTTGIKVQEWEAV
jgi:hypothetical protein